MPRFPSVGTDGGFIGSTLSWLDGKFVGKGEVVLNVKDYGAKGDGVTYDNTPVTSALADAKAKGATLYWPRGTYALTLNQPDFWDVPHIGEGVLKRSGQSHYITPRSVNDAHQRNVIYLDGTNGSDTNDGLSSGFPLKSLAALDTKVLSNLGNRAHSGEWRVVLKGTITGGRFFGFNTKFTEPLVFQGEELVDGSPVTTIQYDAGVGNIQGMWFETSTQITVEKLRVVGFKSSGLGYGIGIKGPAKFLVRSCVAEGADCGFAAINQADAEFENCRTVDCTFGYKAQYSSAVTWDTCTATGSGTGFYTTRNAVTHLDYCTVEGSTYAGMRTDMASRCISLQSHFKRNAVAVMAMGMSEWANSGSFFYHGTADANTKLFDHYGTGHEELSVTTAANEWRVFGGYDTVAHSGSTANKLLRNDPKAGFPALYFGDPRKKVRLRMWGNITGTAGTKLFRFYEANPDGTTPTVFPGVTIPADYAGRFLVEVELMALSFTSQTLLIRAEMNNRAPILTTGTSAKDLSGEKIFRPAVQLDGVGDAMTLEGFEVYRIG